MDENCIPSVGLGIPDFGLEYVIIVIHIGWYGYTIGVTKLIIVMFNVMICNGGVIVIDLFHEVLLV